MKRILVPTDFSNCANNAVDFAVQSAKLLSIEVLLVHSFELSGNKYTDYMGVNREFNQSLLHDAKNEFARLKSVIKETEGVTVESFVSATSLKDTIEQASRESNTDFIVMGTSGASGLKEKLWGSKTAGIIGKSEVPVMAIPVSYKWKSPKKILLIINHFETDTVLLNFLFRLANSYKATVYIAVFTDAQQDEVEHAGKIETYENELKKQYPSQFIVINHIYGKQFEPALQEYVEKNSIDMLAMIGYQRTFPDNLFHPSLTKKMAYHTRIPLLAIPANKPV